MIPQSRSGSVLRTLLFGVLLLFVTAAAPAIAQSSARPSPVEVVAPKPPTPVMIEGKRVLVYELHITNFGPSALTLTGIQVFGSGPKSSVSGRAGSDILAEYSGRVLSDLLHPVDESSQMGTSDSSQMASSGSPGKLDVGHRVIAFMYVSIPEALRISGLRHRFSFDVVDASRSKGTPNDETALDGVMVPLLQQSPLMLSPPFEGGVWLAGNGPSNTSVHRRSVVAIDGRAWISQRFAIDWVMVGKNGTTFHDSRDRNENFWGFGQPVLAVADGEVTEVVDNIPDNIPGKLPAVTVQNITGNHVIMRIAAGTYVTFAHLKQGSIRVRFHERIKRGVQIAQLGNSGNTTAAHLHLQVTDGNSVLASEGIPFVFDRFGFLGFGKDFEEDHHLDLPRSRTLPMDDSVIAFP